MWYFLLFIKVIDRSFGFDTAVEEAQRAINAAHVEAESIENGIGVVKLMGRYSGKFSTFCSIFCNDFHLLKRNMTTHSSPFSYIFVSA